MHASLIKVPANKKALLVTFTLYTILSIIISAEAIFTLLTYMYIHLYAAVITLILHLSVNQSVCMWVHTSRKSWEAI